MTPVERAILASQREILLALKAIASNQQGFGQVATATNCQVTADNIENFIFLNKDEE